MYPAMASARDYQLTPSSKWVLDYAPDSCKLARVVGTGDDKIVIEFVEYEPASAFDLNLIGKPVSDTFDNPVVQVRFGPTGNFVRADAVNGTAGNLPALFLSARLDNFDRRTVNFDELAKLAPAERHRLLVVTPAVEAAVSSVTIRILSRTITLNLGPMGPPMAALRKCTTSLVKQWGLDPVEQEALAIGPKPKSNPRTWLNSSDYPQDALAAGHQAIIRFRLMIDATGQITGCTIQSAMAKEDFAKISCDLLTRRVRFEPALTASGLAVASYFVGKVQWLL